jgi:putative ABC transport system ATP-binding protein
MLSTQAIPLLQVCQLLPLKGEHLAFLEELFLELRTRQLSDEQLLQQLTASTGDYFSWIELSHRNLLQESVHEYLVYPLGDDEWLVITPGNKPILHFISPLVQQQFPLKISRLNKLLKAKDLNTSAETPLRWLHFIPNQSPVSAKKTPFSRLLTLLRLEGPDLRLIVLYSVVLGVLELGIPVTIQALVNNVAFGMFGEPVFVLTFLLLLGLAVMAVIKAFRLIIVEMLQRRLFLQVAQETTQRLVNINTAKYRGKKLAELVNRFLDVVTVQKGASFLLLDGLTLLLQTITGLGLLAFYHPYLLFFDIALISGMLIVLFGLGWGSVRTSLQESSQKYATVAWLEEIAEHTSIFKATMGNHYAMHRTRAFVQKYLKARAGHFQVLLRQNIGAFSLQAIASASLLGLGGWLVVNQELTIGQLVAAELIVAGVVSSFSNIGKHLESFYDLLAAIDKIGYLFDLPQEPQRLNLLPTHENKGVEVRFEHVSAGPGADYFKDFDFKIEAGEKIAIISPLTPSARYFLNLLEGVQTPEKGWVRVNGMPIHHLRLSDYRSQVVQLSQLDVIQDTLLNNLRLGSSDLTRQQAQELLEKTGLWSRVQQFPELLDTPLLAEGQPFSLPEAHRLMLARALAMRPRLLILDRILDATQWQEEGPISQWLTSAPDVTVILLTQIEPLARRFDKVLCFDRDSGQLIDYSENTGGKE